MNNSRHQKAAAGILGVVLSVLVHDVGAQLGSAPLREAIKRYETASFRYTPRVIGGTDTTLQRNPWQAALAYFQDTDRARGQFCGAVIVHPRWVLTAAHCVDQGTRSEQIHVISGTALLVGFKGEISEVERIMIHPGWSSTTADSDIALVRVKTPMAGKPIAAARDSSALVHGAKIWVSGWGVTDKPEGHQSLRLQGISLDYIPSIECNGPLSYNGRITENMFCAGIAGRRGGGERKDACRGDGGGPATVGPEDSAQLVGLVSWGDGCSQPYKYGVYTKVANFARWVRDTTMMEVDW